MTSAPSVNKRFNTTPLTRARTCAVRKASTRPGNSVCKPTVCISTLMTPT
ncbi:hypothetical protein ACVBEH_16925 [Roseateles sp. GG27B]